MSDGDAEYRIKAMPPRCLHKRQHASGSSRIMMPFCLLILSLTAKFVIESMGINCFECCFAPLCTYTPRRRDWLSVLHTGVGKMGWDCRYEGKAGEATTINLWFWHWTVIFPITVVCFSPLSPLLLTRSLIHTLAFSPSPTSYFSAPFSDRKHYRHYRSLDTVRETSKESDWSRGAAEVLHWSRGDSQMAEHNRVLARPDR